MATLDLVTQKLRRFQENARHAGKLTGVTTFITYVDESGASSRVIRDPENSNKIFVRLDESDTQTLTEDARAPIAVWNLNKVQYKEGVYVELAYDRAGDLEIAGADNQLMHDAYEQAAGTIASPELVGELKREIVPGWRFKPLRVRPHESGGLNVVIEDGRYQYANASYAWLDKTPLDIASVSVSSGNKRPVIIGIEPGTDTAVLAYGSEVSLALPAFTLADYNTVATDNLGRIWLFGYEHKNGKTTFADLYDLIDIREYISPSGGVSSGQFFMPINLTFDLTIPAGYQVAVRRLNITTGTLTINGVLDIF